MSPTIGRSYSFSSVVRKAFSLSRTFWLSRSRSKMSRLAIATAADTGWPPKV